MATIASAFDQVERRLLEAGTGKDEFLLAASEPTPSAKHRPLAAEPSPSSKPTPTCVTHKRKPANESHHD